MDNRKDDFDNSFQEIIINEGNYSNDPVDPGGETIYGITKRDYPEVFTQVYFLYTNGQKNLALITAKNFYRKEFWNDLYEQIPDSSLSYKIFDLSVNRGKPKAIKLLQETLFFDFGRAIARDGIFGKITLAAIQSIINQELLYQKYIERNKISYSKLSTAWKYLNGWLNRLRKRVYA